MQRSPFAAQFRDGVLDVPLIPLFVDLSSARKPLESLTEKDLMKELMHNVLTPSACLALEALGIDATVDAIAAVLAELRGGGFDQVASWRSCIVDVFCWKKVGISHFLSTAKYCKFLLY